MSTAFVDKLKLGGERMTVIRKKIIGILTDATTPLSVQDILKKVKANKTTIYRQFDFLKAKKIVVEIDLLDGKKRYELKERGHHHHLICTNCDRIQEINLGSDLKKEEKMIEKNNNFKVTKHSLEFFGLCDKCWQK